MEKQNSKCLSYEVIERYVNNLDEMASEEIYAVSDHLYVCEQCSELARSIRIFDFLLDGWTAESHGNAYKWMDCNETDSVTVKNLNDLTPGRVIAALKVSIKESMQLLAENIETLIGFPPVLNFSASTSPRSVNDDTDGQVTNRATAMSKTGNVSLIVKLSPEGLVVVVNGFTEADSLEVLLQADEQGPLVGSLVKDKKFKDRWSTVFSDIPKGEYTLVFKSDKEIK